MDWINEKLEYLREKAENLSLKRVLILYLLAALLAGFVCTCVTNVFCERWLSMVYRKNSGDAELIYVIHGQNQLIYPKNVVEKMTDSDENAAAVLNGILFFSPFIYAGLFIILAALRFYSVRLKRPFEILKTGTEEIKRNNLDFAITYKNKNEMGELCISFENMRQELVANKEKLWDLVEEQKKINAAFAHDLRTPLTVLKGYTDFLYRYIPEGKISEDKLRDTLKLMSQHLERLTAYSRTMKNIRSFEEMEPQKAEITFARLQSRLAETSDALNQIGDIKIQFSDSLVLEAKKDEGILWIDEIMVMEVFDNLLSNAIRFAVSIVEIGLEIETDNGMLYLYVKDDGPGFTEEELKRAAQPYFHGEEQKGEHFGIGLHIAQQLCQKHGGDLSLANSIEGGALVSVSFFCRKS